MNVKATLIPMGSFALAVLLSVVSGSSPSLALRSPAAPTGCECIVRINFPDPQPTATAKGWLEKKKDGTGSIQTKGKVDVDYNGSSLDVKLRLRIFVEDLKVTNIDGEEATGSAFGTIGFRNINDIEGQGDCQNILTSSNTLSKRVDDGTDLGKAIEDAAHGVANAHNLGTRITWNERAARNTMRDAGTLLLAYHVEAINTLPDQTMCTASEDRHAQLILDAEGNGEGTYE